MDLTILADFNLVAAHGGFAAAARLAKRSKATLSRNVRRLEDELGARLIERNSHAFRLTDDGRMLFARSDALLAEVREIGEEIKGRAPEPRGRLRLSAPVVFSHVFLGRLAAEYGAAFPFVRLEVTAEDRQVDLVEEGYDLVVRINPSTQGDLVGRCFCRDRYLVVAPPHQQSPPPAGAAPARAVGLARWEERGNWQIGGTPHGIAYELKTRLPSLLMVRDAVVAGAGVAALPLSVVGRDLKAGRLVSWGDLADGEVEIWVLHTSRRTVNNRVQSFVGFLCDWFSRVDL